VVSPALLPLLPGAVERLAARLGPGSPGLSGFGMRHWPTRQRRKDKDVGDIRMAADTGLGQGYAIMITAVGTSSCLHAGLDARRRKGAIPAGAGDELGRH